MTGILFIVGPTGVGKSEIAVEIACRLNAEIVSADAFQIYRGLDLLTAKPEKEMLARVPHHMLSVVPPGEEMNAEKFRVAATAAIQNIQARGKQVIVAGGSGLYVKALTHGLTRLPAADPRLREQLNELSLDELRRRLIHLDPNLATKIDLKNRRRVSRALEIRLLGDQPSRDSLWTRPATSNGFLVFREREELYERIDCRVKKMFPEGVVEEVRTLGDIGPTAEKALGVREIRDLLAGRISEVECVARIQQATRRYAKRQLTWFRRQHNFEPLNLSLTGISQAIELLAQPQKALGVAPSNV